MAQSNAARNNPSMNTIKLGLCGTAAVLLALLLIMEQGATKKLRAESQALRQQLAQQGDLSQENQRLSNHLAQASAPAALPEDQLRELLRLRGEVALLRRQKSEFEMGQAANPPLRAGSSNQENNAASQASPDYLPKESLAFAGYGNPDSAVRSGLWANTTQDGKTILAGFSPERQEEWLKLHKTPEGVAAQIARCPVGANMSKVKGFRILNKQTPSESEAYYTVYVEGLDLTFKEKYKRIDSEWKFDGEVAPDWNP
jgi:hypothetical protein